MVLVYGPIMNGHSVVFVVVVAFVQYFVLLHSMLLLPSSLVVDHHHHHHSSPTTAPTLPHSTGQDSHVPITQVSIDLTMSIMHH